MRTKAWLAASVLVGLLLPALAQAAMPPSADAPAPLPAEPAINSSAALPSRPDARAPATAQAGAIAQIPSSPEIKTFCANVAMAASDARVAWQTEKLNDLQTRINARIDELKAKSAELRRWLQKREQLQREANEKLVGIYSKMKPETAATQIVSLDDDLAAVVLTQLNPRQASAIFNEIVPEKAAKLAELIAGSGDKKP